MVKVVDNYVLERVIGKGQFGEVYKGYNKSTGEDIAVKSVCRKNLKGKFYELLENEIKVLRTCNNPNIIKLYDIKKTKNNIYLILEYCNEGDLMQFIKKKERLTEDEAIEFLVQILTAFKTLVRNNIMHRDFKLANILLHNGMIKVADFGFAKLLGNDTFTNTMLGSPLNMAPEVLEGSEYNNKADIWSIGTCFYELLYGRPPYTAKNIVELLQNIKNKQLYISKSIPVSDVTLDVLKKMLVVDPGHRIDWEDLFEHKINFYLEDKIMHDLEETMKADDCQMNMSRFYIKNNKVIENVAEIDKKEDINNYTYEVTAKQNKAKSFAGNYVKRQTERDAETQSDPTPQKNADETINENDGENQTTETLREKMIKIFKNNSSRLLHERNKYVFLASVAEDAISFALVPKNNLSEMVGFILIKKLFYMIGELKELLEEKHNIYDLESWDDYTETKDFSKIYVYISKEYDVFKVYYDSMHENVKKNSEKSSISNDLVQKCLTADSKQQLEAVFFEILIKYVKSSVDAMKSNEIIEDKQKWIHLNQICDSLVLDSAFEFKKGDKQFNFKLFYEEFDQHPLSHLRDVVVQKHTQISASSH